MCYCGVVGCDGPMQETMESEAEFRARMDREALFRMTLPRVAKRHKRTRFSAQDKYTLGLRHARESGFLGAGMHPAIEETMLDSPVPKPITARSDFRFRLDREEEDTAPVEASEALVGVTLKPGEDDSDGITLDHIQAECARIRAGLA